MITMSKITVSFDAPNHVRDTDAARSFADEYRSQADSVGLHNWTFESYTTPPSAATLTVDELVALGVSRERAESIVAAQNS